MLPLGLGNGVFRLLSGKGIVAVPTTRFLFEFLVLCGVSATATGPKVTDGARRVAEVEAAFLEQVEKYLGL